MKVGISLIFLFLSTKQASEEEESLDDPKEPRRFQRPSLLMLGHQPGRCSKGRNLAPLCCYSLGPYVYVFSPSLTEKIRTKSGFDTQHRSGSHVGGPAHLKMTAEYSRIRRNQPTTGSTCSSGDIDFLLFTFTELFRSGTDKTRQERKSERERMLG